MSRRKTQEEFIDDITKVHGDRYDYSKVVYKRLIDTIEIGCKIHGFFTQRALDHQTGRGCFQCAKDLISKLKSESFEYFVKNCRKVHGNKYKYVETVSSSKLRIENKMVIYVCNTHGKVTQSASLHKSGNGCPKCGKENSAKNRRIDFDELQERSSKKHEDKYKINFDNYKNTSSKLTMTCKDHGDFAASFSVHMRTKGGGCYMCKKLFHIEKVEKTLSGKKERETTYNRTVLYKKRALKRKTDKVYALSLRVRGRIRESLKRNKIIKKESTESILGCSFEEFKLHIEKQFCNGMRWDRFNEIHIDHIIPLSSANTEEDVIRLNHFTNLRPLWAKDNLSKGAKMEHLL